MAHVRRPAAKKIPSIHKPFSCFLHFSLVLRSQEAIFPGFARAAQSDHGPAHTHTRTFITPLVPQRANTPVYSSKVNSTRFLPAVYMPLCGIRILGEERLPNKPPRVYLNQLNCAL